MPKETIIKCDRCKKKKAGERDCHWATVHYHDTFGGNDGAGSIIELTDITFYLCPSCKRVVFNIANGLFGKDLKC